MEDSLGRTNEAVGRSNISTCVESVNIFEDGASWPKGLESAYEEVARKIRVDKDDRRRRRRRERCNIGFPPSDERKRAPNDKTTKLLGCYICIT